MELSITNMILSAGPIGQFVMLTLLIFSLASWTIILGKVRLFRKVRIDSEDFLSHFWRSTNLNEVQRIAPEFEYSPHATIFTASFEELDKVNQVCAASGRAGSPQAKETTMDNLKRIIDKTAAQEAAHLAKNLPFLATTGAATPFIGLFGTVWGIMASFHDIGQRGSASLAVVAPGISEALVATAAGLAVAIPAVICYNFFASRIEAVDNEMEYFSADLLNLVERDLISRVK